MADRAVSPEVTLPELAAETARACAEAATGPMEGYEVPFGVCMVMANDEVAKRLTPLILAALERVRPVCTCEPCPDCGYKHYCNASVPHTVLYKPGYCPTKEK